MIKVCVALKNKLSSSIIVYSVSFKRKKASVSLSNPALSYQWLLPPWISHLFKFWLQFSKSPFILYLSCPLSLWLKFLVTFKIRSSFIYSSLTCNCHTSFTHSSLYPSGPIPLWLLRFFLNIKLPLSDLKRQIWTWTEIQTSDLRISSLALYHLSYSLASLCSI